MTKYSDQHGLGLANSAAAKAALLAAVLIAVTAFAVWSYTW
jgi:hypothetical protein